MNHVAWQSLMFFLFIMTFLLYTIGLILIWKIISRQWTYFSTSFLTDQPMNFFWIGSERTNWFQQMVWGLSTCPTQVFSTSLHGFFGLIMTASGDFSQIVIFVCMYFYESKRVCIVVHLSKKVIIIWTWVPYVVSLMFGILGKQSHFCSNMPMFSCA